MPADSSYRGKFEKTESLLIFHPRVPALRHIGVVPLGLPFNKIHVVSNNQKSDWIVNISMASEINVARQ